MPASVFTTTFLAAVGNHQQQNISSSVLLLFNEALKVFAIGQDWPSMTYLRVATSGRLSLQNFNFPMQRGRSFILDGLWSERLFKRSQRRPIETTWGQTPRRKNILKKTETPFTIAVKIILLKKKKNVGGHEYFCKCGLYRNKAKF